MRAENYLKLQQEQGWINKLDSATSETERNLHTTVHSTYRIRIGNMGKVFVVDFLTDLEKVEGYRLSPSAVPDHEV